MSRKKGEETANAAVAFEQYYMSSTVLQSGFSFTKTHEYSIIKRLKLLCQQGTTNTCWHTYNLVGGHIMDSLSPRDYLQQEFPFCFVRKHVIDECSCIGNQCHRCEDTVCIHGFYHDKRRSRPSSVCLGCHKNYHKKYNASWYSSHAEEHNARISEHRQNNKEQNKIYRQRRAKKINAYHRTYNKKYPERIREYNRKSYQINKNQTLHRNQAYRESHTEQFKEYWHRYYQRYPGRIAAKSAKRRALKVQSGGSYTEQEWIDLKDCYNYTCLCCGKREPEIKLCADHVIPIVKGGSSYISNIQPLCGSCNSRKHVKVVDYRLRWKEDERNT